MIIVTGSVLTNDSNRAAIEAECLRHSRRSRLEEGCLVHDCHYDVEQTNKLVIVEKWASANSLVAHFAVPETRAFLQAVTTLAEAQPEIAFYNAEAISLADLMASA